MKTVSFRCSRGFTLIESLVAVGIAAVLSSLAYPSLEGHVLRVRRADALVGLMQAQLAQERFRANNVGYGSLAEIGVPATSTAGYYNLQVTAASSSSYQILASATGRQGRDATCRHLRLAMEGAQLSYASGADPSVANAAAVNRGCWNQ